MIKLSNGHEFEYMVASGALAFDGKGWLWERPLVWLGLIKPELFTVVIKTLTLHPRKGNLRWWKPWECVSLIPGGSVNKIGLTNKGIRWWCENIGWNIDYQKYPTVGSIFGDQDELVEMAEILNSFDFVALEVNPSCPNTGHSFQTTEDIIKMVKAVKKISFHPIIVKVSVDQDIVAIANGLEGVAEAVSLNSVPWKTAYKNGEITPLWKLEEKVGGGGGGVSGKPAQKFNWAAVNKLAVHSHSMPIIGPSVMKYEDMETVRRAGARAVSFGAIHLAEYPVWLRPWSIFTQPCKPTRFVQREKEEQKKRKEKHEPKTN